MEYELTAPLQGEPAVVLSEARSILMTHNFRLDRVEDTCLEAVDPGRQGTTLSFYGANRLILTAGKNQLHLQVETSDFRKEKKFLNWLLLWMFLSSILVVLLVNPTSLFLWGVTLGAICVVASGIWITAKAGFKRYEAQCRTELETFLKNLSQLR